MVTTVSYREDTLPVTQSPHAIITVSMVDIRFEQDAPRQNFRNPNSRLTQFFIDKSFGLVKTPAQAAILQAVVAIALFILAGFLFARGSETNLPASPNQDLINRPQPTRPINR